MLCIKQTFALILFALLSIISIYIIPSIHKSIESYNELQKPRNFHNRQLFRHGNYPLEDHHHDIDVDIGITYPHATLTVDEPVDISVITAIKPELFSTVKSIVIGFNAAQAYPSTSRELPGIDLAKTQDNRMIGDTKISWPIEGTYKANISMEFNNGMRIQTDSVDLITVCSKSQITQMVTNKALIGLSIATYLVGVMATLNIIIPLWGSP